MVRAIRLHRIGQGSESLSAHFSQQPSVSRRGDDCHAYAQAHVHAHAEKFLAGAASAALGASAAAARPARAAEGDSPVGQSPGSQRLSLAQLRKWESLQYGMFIHFGMSTFLQKEIPDGTAPLSTYAPDRLDVDQWVSVARDAGMKYVVLTAKHVAGHCLWPSKHTSYTVANSRQQGQRVRAVLQVMSQTRRPAGLLLLLLGQPPPLRKQDALPTAAHGRK